MALGITIIILFMFYVFLDIKLKNTVDSKYSKRLIKDRIITMVVLPAIWLLSLFGGAVTRFLSWTVVVILVLLVIERIYYIANPFQYEDRLDQLQQKDFEVIEKYYFREKVFNFIGTIISVIYILHGELLILSSPQILFIVFFRKLVMKRRGVIESFIFLFLFMIGDLFKENYIIIRYFDYMVLGHFLAFLIYFLYKGTEKKGVKEIIGVLLGITIIFALNNHIANDRLVKDPQLNKIVNQRYQRQYRVKGTLKADDPRVAEIIKLELSSRYVVKTLEGIGHFENLMDLTIEKQKTIIDYSQLQQLNQLKGLIIRYPNENFRLQDIPKMESLEDLSINFGGQITDEELRIDKFPNLRRLYLQASSNGKPVTLDIRNAPKLEYIEILGIDVKEIVGLEDAKNLKSITLYHPSEEYIDEIKRLRPDIIIK